MRAQAEHLKCVFEGLELGSHMQDVKYNMSRVDSHIMLLAQPEVWFGGETKPTPAEGCNVVVILLLLPVFN